MIKIFNFLTNKQSEAPEPDTSWNQYYQDVLNRSTDPDLYEDTMQCFFGSVAVKGSTIYMYYTANTIVDGDIDKVHVQYKEDDGNYISGWTKHGVALRPRLANTQIFSRGGSWYETDDNRFKLYGTESGPGIDTRAILSESLDGLNFTFKTIIYEVVGEDVFTVAIIKRGTNDYIGIAAATPGFDTGLQTVISSTDGENFTSIGTLQLTDMPFITDITKIGNIYYLIGPMNPIAADSKSANIGYITTTDFVTFTSEIAIIEQFQPSEAALNLACWHQLGNKLIVFYTYYMNQDKYPAEPYTEGRMLEINGGIENIKTPTKIYPTYTKRYYPLYHEGGGSTLTELILETSITKSPLSYNSKKFLDLTSDTVSFPSIGIPSVSAIALKMRITIDLIGTKTIFQVSTDIVVELVSGKLRVSLNNNTKQYISDSVIEVPEDIGSPGLETAVFVGFIWRDSTLTLCNGNDVDYAATKTIDGAMADITDSQSNVVIGNSEVRSVTLNEGITDQEWIDLDL